MQNYPTLIRQQLRSSPANAAQLIDVIGISQPTLSRALQQMGDEVLRFGAARSIHYALRDAARGVPDVAVYRVDPQGCVALLGHLMAVMPEGFVMRQADGRSLHSDGLPWWLLDMRPQGYLGRAWAQRHAQALQLPPRIAQWSDRQTLQALLMLGADHPGNLLLGEQARQQFLAQRLPPAIALEGKTTAYAALAQAASAGELPGSSAGGEQPKFTAYAWVHTALSDRAERGEVSAQHVLVKFTERDGGAVAERWRDVLLCEHLALQTLAESGVAAAQSQWLHTPEQAFLEVQRFDRTPSEGRHGLISLAALDAEFVGNITLGWPGVCQALAKSKTITPQAASTATLLWAFGSLIGNTDMHGGNLSFLTDQGRPYELAPAYDMSPMAFAPRSGGGLPDALPALQLRADIPHVHWHQALALAQSFVAKLYTTSTWSPRFSPCLQALTEHVKQAEQQIRKLA
ncbi:type II toxin-antitoxin system HipA family toxin YjjJ [Lampropedia puyangensis]|uniref:Type II toxin-antitoxin system HipA family toxin YjjJ n=1 Tax=Lampropedia puyangensis TaxID=1330072 RepID=A0A4S8EX46_9BURK|nr:type II toxin-antitoxin system HipA family toxin YjjJ [Lampropedia puyangensis]THT98434.1 type II toxin-antitoxin system HipA family toxin YjjJ [Lampropedia puyangensis]